MMLRLVHLTKNTVDSIYYSINKIDTQLERINKDIRKQKELENKLKSEAIKSKNSFTESKRGDFYARELQLTKTQAQ